jgi:hypothetical protein
LLAGAAFVVKGDDVLGGASHVGDNISDARIKLARMPLDLGDDPTWLRPGSGLISKVRVGTPHFVRRTADGAVEEIADPLLQDPVGGKPNGVFDPLGFEVLVNFRIREARVRPKIDA